MMSVQDPEQEGLVRIGNFQILQIIMIKTLLVFKKATCAEETCVPGVKLVKYKCGQQLEFINIKPEALSNWTRTGHETETVGSHVPVPLAKAVFWVTATLYHGLIPFLRYSVWGTDGKVDAFAC